MIVGAIAEPLLVITLLVGGVWVNRDANREISNVLEEKRSLMRRTSSSSDRSVSSCESASSPEPLWRARELSMLGFKKSIKCPNTRIFEERRASKILRRYPFIIEVVYWGMIYWVYQLGRAVTAVTLLEGTINVARRHALELIDIEKRLGIFWELSIQKLLMQSPSLMHWTNRLYSFVHIPASIFFLIWLYHTTRHRRRSESAESHLQEDKDVETISLGPHLYEARRRTMATCNLIAFVIFTVWPCMPPRLLSDMSATGEEGTIARSYGFVDTVHGARGESSVWTQNRFCNQYAAMPSLHFGYALLIGWTIATIPFTQERKGTSVISLPVVGVLRLPSIKRVACAVVGFGYTFLILVAIIATANHFVLDAVVGAMVCMLGWKCNSLLLNLLPLEDCLCWALRIHKPSSDSKSVQVEKDWDQLEVAAVR